MEDQPVFNSQDSLSVDEFTLQLIDRLVPLSQDENCDVKKASNYKYYSESLKQGIKKHIKERKRILEIELKKIKTELKPQNLGKGKNLNLQPFIEKTNNYQTNTQLMEHFYEIMLNTTDKNYLAFERNKVFSDSVVENDLKELTNKVDQNLNRIKIQNNQDLITKGLSDISRDIIIYEYISHLKNIMEKRLCIHKENLDKLLSDSLNFGNTIENNYYPNSIYLNLAMNQNYTPSV